ncbi:MAG: glycosyltransferase family 2 protein [Prevotella sp.]|nr:glycosyltransferase family 2 protein [Prevotella sp.]MBO7537718.1 glycosyltransferase family 2 protein [Prevotella sp.]
MKISILVPVYGVEKYISQCAKTLFEQTYNDIEYIFVDDCSPDNSIAVLQQVLANYPRRQHQVNIIRHEHNRGLGATRKTAFDFATGDFVMNVDSDDYLSLDAVEKLVNKQKETGADIISSSYMSHFEDGTTVPHQEPHLNKDGCLKLMLIQNTLLPHIWARLIRRNLYVEHEISSVEGINMAEDLALTPRLIHAAESISYIEDITYYYRDDSSASTFANHLSSKHVLSLLKANQELWVYFNKNDLKGNYLFAMEIGMLNTYHQALKAGLTKKEVAKVLSYKPQHLLFRILNGLFAHKKTMALLRFAFLSTKWFYKKLFFIKERHSSSVLT